MRERERQYLEPTVELLRSFKLTVGGLGRVINLHYENIVFKPLLEEVFQETEGTADLHVLVSLTKDEYMMPKGRWEGGVLYAELVNRRPILQVQKLVAALHCLESESLYSLHGALAQPPDLSEKTIAFLGSSGTGKGTVISRLCGLSDPKTGQQSEACCLDAWQYFAEEVLLFDSQREAVFLTGKVRTRCLDFHTKRVIIEPGDVKSEGYSVVAFMLLDKNKPGGEVARLKTPVIVPNEVIGHSNIANSVYKIIIERPCLVIRRIPVYSLGTNGNIPATIEVINKVADEWK